jgi:outer membrane protein OmpA-like peptidoglycan-associated protein
VSLVMTGPSTRWPGSARNGVNAENYGDYPAGFRFEGGQNTTAGAPAQAPIADSLRRQGRVALYINFRTGSADLDVAAAPVLTQLRDAMQADPGMRLRISGHTDSQGTPASNTPLSQRRAAAVVAWLTQNGVAGGRLVSEGRGQGQPIADNGSDAGRALNRRVEAERLD